MATTSAFGARTILVNFAWSDERAQAVTVNPGQTLRDAVAPLLPPNVSRDRIGIIDTIGNDVTNKRGEELEQNTHVIVNPVGFVPGGVSAASPQR